MTDSISLQLGSDFFDKFLVLLHNHLFKIQVDWFAHQIFYQLVEIQLLGRMLCKKSKQPELVILLDHFPAHFHAVEG
jgi:hypothetical protein